MGQPTYTYQCRLSFSSLTIKVKHANFKASIRDRKYEIYLLEVTTYQTPAPGVRITKPEMMLMLRARHRHFQISS